MQSSIAHHSQHNRASLVAYTRSLRHPSLSDKRELEEKRRRLQIEISKYEKKWAALSLFDEAIELQTNHLSLLDEEVGVDVAASDDEEDVVVQPEAVTLFLPSNLSKEVRQLHNLDEMGNWEAKLRIGQMNDALRQLRIALGEKSMIYRANVCFSSTVIDDLTAIRSEMLAVRKLRHEHGAR